MGSNDNPPPNAAATHGPITLAEWRRIADDDFGSFRQIDRFLAMTDAELATAAAEFPKQIAGTAARLIRLKHRLADQYDTVTTVLALLDRARTFRPHS